MGEYYRDVATGDLKTGESSGESRNDLRHPGCQPEGGSSLQGRRALVSWLQPRLAGGHHLLETKPLNKNDV